MRNRATGNIPSRLLSAASAHWTSTRTNCSSCSRWRCATGLMSDVPLADAFRRARLEPVVALMAKEFDRPVDTFSVGFRGDPRSELPDARRVAELFGCEHHELELSVTADTLSLDELVWHLDEPVADLSTLGFDVLRLAAET